MDVLQYKIDAKPTDSRNDSLEIILEKIESLPRIYRYKKSNALSSTKRGGRSNRHFLRAFYQIFDALSTVNPKCGNKLRIAVNDADVCTTPNDVEFIYSTPSFSLFPTT